jgi:hypothetical protein
VPIRDIDLVAIKDLSPDLSKAEELAQQYMPRDFSYGDGVELIEDTDIYFQERDFTLNEVLLVGNRLYVSTGALKAIEEHIICGSQYELDLFNGWLGPKLALKSLLLQAVLEVSTGEE